MGSGGVGRVGNSGGVVGVEGSENGNRRVVKGEKQLFLTSKKYIFTKNRLQRKDSL